MSRWIRFLIVFLIGLSAGLFYAWRINPIKYVDTSPDTLRQDYKTDYILMVAETYHADGNVANAVQRLALLGDDLPAEMVNNALVYARGESNNNQALYPVEDLTLMQSLGDALKTIQPTVDNP